MAKRRPGESLLKFWNRRQSRRLIHQAEDGRALRLEPLERRELLHADGLFSPLTELPAGNSGQPPVIQPTKFTAYHWDRAEFEQTLANAPLEFTPAALNPIEVRIPNPTGDLARFKIVESPIMEPALQAQFPNIRTYAGQGIDDPAATIRFDVTPAGFHAQVLSPNGAFYVDPAYIGDDDTIISYYKRDLTAAGRGGFAPHADDLVDHDDEGQGGLGGEAGNRVAGRTSGSQLRTYRAAVAATGEYTQFHGGSVALGQAAVVTAMNRVNAVYENDLSIRMVLVSNNSQLIYTNPASDPYTNNNGFTMLGENQANIDTVIGNANYDIGHVFSTGGGGVAALGSVGIDSIKAQGVTGLPAPIGDPFYIDYVSHEVGHQFGGNHTFNADSGACTSNINPATAYEPGSGSTIQAYAGICGDDDLQLNSDPYFHWISLDEMITHVDDVIPTVGTRTATGNAIPNVSAGSDYIIPARTPFVLSATGSDVGFGQVLTYTWEEADLGAQADVNAPDNGGSPIIRSYSATTSPERTVPQLTQLLNNTFAVGERLPAVASDMDFRVTVRDNRFGGGAVNHDEMVARVVNTGTPFQVTSPNTSIDWPALSEQIVTWNVAGTTGNGINTGSVNISMSIDGGFTYPITLATSTPNDGAHKVSVPDLRTGSARIRIQGAGNIFFDISDINFTISDPLKPLELISVGHFQDEILDPLSVNLLDVAPRELSFRFTGGRDLDPLTIPTGIRILRSGGDGDFNNGVVVVQPGFLGLSDTSNSIVIARFAEPLVQDQYRIEIFGRDLPPDGITTTNITGIRAADGVLLSPANGGDRETLGFNLRLAPQVVSVVPQPVTRINGVLDQEKDTIDVYFSDRDLDLATVQSPKFYRLVETNQTLTELDDTLRLPDSAVYNLGTNSVRLKFSSDIATGTYQLRVGESDEPNNTIQSAINVGTLFNATNFTTLTYLGDDVANISTSPTDVDFYAVRLASGQSISINVQPAAGLDAVVRTFDTTQTEILPATNGAGMGGAETAVLTATTAGVYYISVASDPASGGRFGSYRVTLAGVAGQPIPGSDDNSSFATASDLGVLGLAEQSIGSQIEPQSFALLPFPGGNDEPGHRHIPIEDHLNEYGPVLGGVADNTAGIPQFTYSFPLIYGVNPQNVPLQTEISDNQRQRAREIFDLWSRYLGISFNEVTNCVPNPMSPCINIATGDIRAVDPMLPAGTAGPLGVFGNNTIVINGSFDWGNSEYGGQWFTTAMRQIGLAINLDKSFDLESMMGTGLSGEPVFPGNHDIVHGQRLYRPDSNDVDLYKFSVQQAGWFSAETIAERMGTSSTLNTALRLYAERTAIQMLSGGSTIVDGDFILISDGTNTNRFEFDNQFPSSVTSGIAVPFTANSSPADLAAAIADKINDKKLSTLTLRASVTGSSIQLSDRAASVSLNFAPPTARARVFSVGELIAQNDDYFSQDSFIGVTLQPGTYYLGVSSTGNTEYDPAISDTGSNGRTQGAYELKINLTPDAKSAIQDLNVDTNGNPAPKALDGDGDAKPGGNFDFWFRSGNTLFVDKANDRTLAIEGTGTELDPFDNIASAIAQATDGDIVRIVGNPGTDTLLSTPADSVPYLIGLNNSNQPLPDGADLRVPRNVTVMIDSGALLKLQKANIDVGTSSQGVDRSGGALQVLGTPQAQVHFRSFRDDAFGGNSDGVSVGNRAGDWGGLVFRRDLDLASPNDLEADGIFLNWVNNADLRDGGGKVVVNNLEEVFSPVHLVQSRPAISQTAISNSADAAISADPDSFEDSLGRVGPDIHHVRLTSNSVNGLFVRVQTPFGAGVDQLDGFARWDDVDVVHVLTDKLILTGSPGGALDGVARLDARLQIDPGIVVKLQSARIHAEFGAQLFAEGTADLPIIFTSIKDDDFGAGGSFDTKSDGSAAMPAPGDWSGIAFAPTSQGSLDYVRHEFGGGLSPIDGNVASFSAVEIHQADVRIANSLFANELPGNSSTATTRDDLPATGPAVIFVRGAQPIILNNTIRDNRSQTNTDTAAISIDVNSLNGEAIRDPGRSTGLLSDDESPLGNRGALLHGNRMDQNGLNGVNVRGGELTTEGVWDDTDIVHVVQNEIRVENQHTIGSLRLQSSPTESLVVKLLGVDAGFTATGTPLDIDDRIGGSVQVLGQPGFPVVVTSLNDCTVGVGFTPDGRAQADTQSSAKCSSGSGSIGNSGAVLIDGGDRDDHGTVQNGADGVLGTADDINQDGWLFMQQMFEFALRGNRNGAPNDVLAIGVKPGFSNSFGALPAVRSALAPLQLGLTTVTGAQISTVNFSDYKIIYVPSDNFNVTGGIDDSEIALLTQRKADVQAFINSGGSFVALTEAQSATPYAYLELPLPFQITTFGGFLALRKTPAAVAAGFTISDQELSNGTPWHNEFVGPPGFNGLEPFVLDSGPDNIAGNADDQIITLGLRSGSFGIGVDAGGPGDWRSIKLDRYSNDRNVDRVIESEQAVLDGRDRNSTPSTAEPLGVLAPNEKSGDENRRLGFEVHGSIAADNSADVDVYSFSANSGTEVWIDIDRTSAALDTMVELVNVNGTVLARAFNNTPVVGNSGPNPVAFPLIKDTLNGIDWYSTNSRDAGMRVLLPGSPGQNAYFIRVRSQASAGNEDNVTGGLTRGDYQLQVRLRQQDETPGSTVRYSDIRYATTGIEIEGLPAHSPLTGETAEGDDAANNGPGNAQELGNLLRSDQNTVSVGGSISTATDVDWYEFTLDYDLVESLNGINNGPKTFATIFDLDYADGLTRADTVVSVYDAQGRLLLVSRDSDVEDDQPKPGEGNDVDDLTRGSVGKLDPFIGTVQLPAGNIPANSSHHYFVAVSSNRQLPTVLNASISGSATNTTVRLEPVNSLQRIVEDHIGFTGYTTGTTSLNSQVQPKNGPLFELDNSTELAVHVAPFSLTDVQLYVSSQSTLGVVNPFNGRNLYSFGNALAGANTQDISMRSDGQLYGVDSVGGGSGSLAGRFTEIDPANGTEILSADIAIPDFAAATNPENLGELTTDVVDALTFPRNRSSAFYSVRGAHRPGGVIVGGGTSTLYTGDTNNGAAAAGNRRGEIIGSGISGVTTGLAFDATGSQLYGVNDQGQFYRINPANGAIVQLIGNLSGSLGGGESFTGLTLGPQNVENGAYRNLMFASTSNGRIFALDPTRVGTGLPLFLVFDTNNDGAADAINVTTTFGSMTGLAFSPLDFNLWHPTTRGGNLPGHGINAAFDDSRNPGSFTHFVGSSIDSRPQTEQQGGASFYFGLEEANGSFFQYSGTSGQFGVLNSQFQADLTSDPGIGNNYNLPGGAHGKLMTNAFSLSGYTRTDKPTLYFNYMLDAEAVAGSNNGQFVDSARVFISRNNGNSWELVATNNSALSTGANGNAELPAFATPSRDGWSASPNQGVQQLFNGGGWRQARIDLADYAGESNLKLRFDFSTAGRMEDSTLPAVAESSGVGLTSSRRATNNDFEGFYVDDILVGFAERGEMVTASPPDAFGFTQLPARTASAPQEILTGSYQLELRRGTEITSSLIGQLGEPILPTGPSIHLSNQFDTNDRLTTGRSFLAPNGASIIDGQQFTITDGLRSHTFEFDRQPLNVGNPTATLKNPNATRLGITGLESNGEVATLVANAVNGFAWNVKAITKPFNVNSSVVDLIGATMIDFSAGNSRGDLIVSVPSSNCSSVFPAAPASNNICESGANSTTVATITRTGDLSQLLTISFSGFDPTTGVITDEVLFRDPTNALSTANPLQITFAPFTSSINVDVIGQSDSTADGTQPVRLIAAAADYNSITDTIDVADVAMPGELRIIIPSTGLNAIREDAGRAATRWIVQRNTPTTADLRVTLYSSDVTEAQVPAFVIIPAGSSSVSFDIDAIDELLDDGIHNVVITATAQAFLSSEATLSVTSTDNKSEYRRLGDLNADRDQGQVLVTSSVIRDSETYGVRVDAAPRAANGSLSSPGAVRNLPTANTERLAPGPVLMNNVFANNGIAGVQFSGDGTTVPLAAVPFGRLVNNTFFGNESSTGAGIEVTDQASPTILNNIFSSLENAIVTTNNGTATVVINANLFHEVAAQGTDAITLADSDPLFVDAGSLNFYLVSGSLGIDSSRNSLADRSGYVNVKSPLGIPESPILAPSRDLFGQLRIDDSSQNQSFGFGAEVFKDRGAVDRADSLGPFAVLNSPIDGDSQGVDLDPNATVVHLREGNLFEFELLLQDGRGVTLPFEGTGINASTVGPNSVYVTENGVPLIEGTDFTLGFNPSSGTILLTPTSGIWRPASAYTIVLNNRDRFLVTAPTHTRVSDGDQFRISDNSGGTAVFEYESGYRMQIPETMTLGLPAAAVGTAGGIMDGQTFTVSDATRTVRFEFDSNFNSNFLNTRISMFPAATLGNRIVAALQAANIGLEPRLIPGGKIHLGATPIHAVDVSGSSLELSGATNVVADGDTFRVQYDGGATPVDVTFEFDTDGVFDPLSTNTPLFFAQRPHSQEIVNAVINALNDPQFNLTDVKDLGNFLIQIGGTTDHVITLGSTSQFTITGLPGVTPSLRFQVPTNGSGFGGISDGQQFSVTRGTQTVTFEFNSNSSVTPGAIPISFTPFISNQASLANSIVTVLAGAGLGLSPQVIGPGLVQVGEPANALNYSTSVGTSRLVASGVSGGAIPINFEPSDAFTPSQFAGLIAAAINNSGLVGVVPTVRGGGQLFLDGASAIAGITFTAITAIRDNAGNALRPNQPAPGAETMFTILTPGATMDFGDALDNSLTVPGGFATVLVNDGARHVQLSRDRLYFGQSPLDIDTERDGLPTPNANGDNTNGLSNDELLGTATTPSTGITIRRVFTPDTGSQAYRTPIELYASEAGFVDAWIDFNRDGKWDDATEKILSSALVQQGLNTLLAESTPGGIIPTGQLSINSAARFRISTTGGLLPGGLAVNGEVEDHILTIITNTGPIQASGIANRTLREDNNDGAPSDLIIDLSNAFTDIDLNNGNLDRLQLTVVSNSNPGLLSVAIDDASNLNSIDGDRLTITLVQDQNQTNQNGNAVILIRATDHADQIFEIPFTIAVEPVNDPPVVTAPATLAAVEDIVKTVPGISIADLDILEGTGTLSLTLRANNGRLNVRTNVPNGITAAQVTNNGTSDVNITAPLAVINQTLMQTDGLTYQGNPDFNGTDSIIVAPSDMGNFGLAPIPAPPSPNKTIAVNVQAVNDAPTINPPSSLVVNEDAPTGLVLTGLRVNDVDFTASTVARVTLTVTNGRIKLNTSAGLTFPAGADNTSTVTLSGTLSAINAAIDGAQYFSNQHFNGISSLTVTVSDLGNSPGPTALTASSTFAITVNSVNDAPSFTVLGGNQNVNEDSGRRTVPGFVSNISAGPADENGQLLNFRITLSDRQGTLEFVDALPTIDATTGSLVFEPKPNTNGSVVVQVRLEDNGGTALGGENTFPIPPADPVIFTITVNALNDAPEFTKGNNETISEDVGQRSVAWATGIRPGPATALDEQSQSVNFNISIAQITGNLAFTTSPTIDSATGILTYQTAPHTNGQAVVRVSLTDNGASNPPNSNTSATQTFTITVNAINDAPEFTLAGSPTNNEDAGLQTVANFMSGIRPGPVQATDESSGATAQALAVQVTRVPPPIPSPNDLAFSTLPTIDLATGTLTYQTLPESNGSAVFRVRLTDSGSNIQPNVNFSDQTFTITVNAINDAPIFVKGNDVFVNEDSGAVTSANWATGIAAGPPNEANQAPSLTFTTSVVSTTRSLSFTSAPTISADGTLTFTPTPNTNGLAVVRVSLSDSGNGASPNDNTSDDQTFTITVSPTNDPPQLVNPIADFAVNEDSPMTVVELFPSVFSDIDVNAFDSDVLSLRVISNTQILTWQLDTQQITPTTTSANLRLSYLPNRSGQAELIVEATDVNGVSVRDTFTVTVNAVNDAPTIGGPTIINPSLFQPSEELTTQLSGLTIGDVDATENPGGRVNVVLSVNHGVLHLSTSVPGGLTSNDIIPNDASSVTINATPAALNATLNAANGLTYTGNLDYNGPDQLSITVNDNGNSPSTPLSAVATLNFSVNGVNDAPRTSPDTVTTPEDTVLTFASSTLRTNDAAGPTNENTQSLTVISVTATANTLGTVSLQGSNIVYTPRVDFVGTDVFTYTIEDNGQTNGSSAPLTSVGTVTVTITAVNDAPTPESDSQSTLEDVTLVFDASVLVANDKAGAIDQTTRELRSTDEAAQILNVLSVGASSLQGGSVALISGSVRYTPPLNFFGTDTFTYVVQDNGTSNGAPDPKQSIGTVTVSVATVNDDPIANPDTRVGREGTPLVFNASELATNDSPGPNESSQTLTVDAGSALSANGGTVTFNSGVITYNPPANFNGSDTFTYTLRDSGTNSNDRKSSIGTVTVNVSEVNNPPVAAADTRTTAEDTPVAISASSLIANDSRGPANESGQNLSVTNVSALSAQGGTVALNFTTGVITYTPAADFNGTDTFTYTITDDGTTNGQADPKTSVATVTMTVTDVNDVPVAFTDTTNAAEDTTTTVAASVLLANDTRGPANENSQSLTITSVSATTAAGGTVTLVNGVITYTAPSNFTGNDTFSYTVRDNGSSNGVSDPTTSIGIVTVAVSAVNDAPIGTSDLFAAAEDTQLSLLGSDMTVNDLAGPANESSQTLTITAVSPTSSQGGKVSLSNGQVLYTPAADFSGRDTFTYTVQDNGTTNGAADAKSAIATVTIDVSAQNDAPVTVADAYAIDEDTRLIVAGNGILANDFDRDRPVQTLTVANAASITTSSRGATVTVNADGTFTYDPTTSPQMQALRPNQTLQDTFVYQATDGTDISIASTVSITVSGRNDAPASTNETYTVAEDTTLNINAAAGVLLNDSDPEGSVMTATVVSSVSNGVLTLRPDGSFSYTPRNNFNGRDSFVYRSSDGAVASESATVTIDVTPQNDPPVANSDQYTVARDGTLTVAAKGVLANDTDDESQNLTARLVQNTSHGQVTLNNDGSFTYRPTAGYAGSDTFTYRAVDGGNVQSAAVATVSITVTNTRPWQNPLNAMDVNADTAVSAIDVLQIINRLNNEGAHVLASPPDAPPPPYVDTNGDGSITPNDALLVVNFLNARASSGEGESSLAIAEGAFSVDDAQYVVMPMTSGRSSNVEFPESSVVSGTPDNYFAGLVSEDARTSEASESESSASESDTDNDDEFEDYLTGLDELFAVSGDDLI